MNVKELINELTKCNQDMDVTFGYDINIFEFKQINVTDTLEIELKNKL